MLRNVEDIASRISSDVFASHSDDDICGKFDALCDALHDIKVHVARKLNEEHPDFLSRLPTEIHERCFEYLKLRDRIFASQVCSHWRTVAVSHQSLWSDIDMDDFCPDQARRSSTEYYAIYDFRRLNVVEMSLARSGAVPISLRGDDIAEKLSALVWENLHRFRVVEVLKDQYGHNGLVSRFKMPHLTSLAWDRVEFPDHFEGHFVPNLCKLEAKTLVIPELFSPVRSLENLTCDAGSSSGLDRIGDFFPNLRNLTLEKFGFPTILPNRLPRSLDILQMHNGGLDLTQYIRRWSGNHSLRELHMHSPSNLDSIVEFFLAAVGNAEFSIKIMSSVTEIRPFRDDLCKIILDYPNDIYGSTSMCQLHNRVSSLTLDYSQTRFPIRLFCPALTELVFGVYSTSYHQPFDLPMFIVAPSLRHATLRFEMMVEITDSYPSSEGWNIRRSLQFASERLEHLVIESLEIDNFRPHDWTSAFDFTDEVICRKQEDSTIVLRACRPEASVSEDVRAE